MYVPNDIHLWSHSEREVFFWLLRNVDASGKVVFNVRRVSKELGLSYETVRWAKKTLTPKITQANPNTTPNFYVLGRDLYFLNTEVYEEGKNSQPQHNPKFTPTQPQILREKEKFPNREKENFPPHPLYKEKEINPPKERESVARAQKEIEHYCDDSWGEALQMSEGLCRETVAYLLRDAYLYAMADNRAISEQTLKRLAMQSLRLRREEIRKKDHELRQQRKQKEDFYHQVAKALKRSPEVSQETARRFYERMTASGSSGWPQFMELRGNQPGWSVLNALRDYARTEEA